MIVDNQNTLELQFSVHGLGYKLRGRYIYIESLKNIYDAFTFSLVSTVAAQQMFINHYPFWLIHVYILTGE